MARLDGWSSASNESKDARHPTSLPFAVDTCHMKYAFEPTYLKELDISAKEFEQRYLSYWLVEGSRVASMTALARKAADRQELGHARVGLISLMAQSVPQTPVDGPRGRSTRRAQFEVSEDIVAIARTVCTTESHELQIGRTNWHLAELAFWEFLPDLSTHFLTDGAEEYVSRRRWPQVATLYSNLGLSEAGAGHTGAAIGWLNLSAQVSRSLNEEGQAELTESVANAIRREPGRFFAPTMQMKKLVSSPAVAPPGALVTEVYGLGIVAISAITPSLIDALRMADRLGDTLLEFVDTDWPRAVIAAAAVDLRVISRILEAPEVLDDLEPRALEVLIGKLFRGFGASVELTKETRDGGYDVEANFLIGEVRFRVLIEAKRWRQDRKVGLATVDRLIGVKTRLKADKVVLATTSTFTNVAKQAAAELHTEIELVDRDGLADWVEQYLLPGEGSALRLPSIPVKEPDHS